MERFNVLCIYRNSQGNVYYTEIFFLQRSKLLRIYKNEMKKKQNAYNWHLIFEKSNIILYCKAILSKQDYNIRDHTNINE